MNSCKVFDGVAQSNSIFILSNSNLKRKPNDNVSSIPATCISRLQPDSCIPSASSRYRYSFIYLCPSETTPTGLSVRICGRGENWARYSIIGLGESTVFSCNAGELTVQHPDGSIEKQHCSDPFQYIRDFQKQFKVPTQAELPSLPSFTGGLVGYFGYDSVRYIEPKLKMCLKPIL